MVSVVSIFFSFVFSTSNGHCSLYDTEVLHLSILWRIKEIKSVLQPEAFTS